MKTVDKLLLRDGRQVLLLEVGGTSDDTSDDVEKMIIDAGHAPADSNVLQMLLEGRLNPGLDKKRIIALGEVDRSLSFALVPCLSAKNGGGTRVLHGEFRRRSWSKDTLFAAVARIE